MLEIPIQPIPAQVVKSVLGGQNVQIFAYQKPQGLFVDVNVDGVDVIVAAIARDVTPLIAATYSGVVGNLLFVDTLGSSDPDYTGLGSRFSLVYLSDAEYALIQQ